MTDKLTIGLSKINLSLTNVQISQLKMYINEVLEFNKSYNLMKAENADELAVNHILDSLVAIPYLQKLIEELCQNTNKSVLELADIGSGGGCPGIPLAICFNNHNFTLVERMEKRADFLSLVIKKLGLQNVKIECKNADQIPQNSFDLEVFRAFHPFDTKITNLLLKMINKGGYIAAYKAREEKIINEMQSIKQIVPEYQKIKMTVPFLEDHERNLVIIKK